jgi:SNF2 family DNA or RNA helicase
MLSGTPILNRAMEIWTPLNMMFPKDKRFTSYWRFAKNHCEVIRGQFGWEVRDILNPRDPRIKSLRKELEPIYLRRTKPEVLKELPAKTVQQVWIELGRAQRRVYNDMEETMLAEFEERRISAAVIIAQIIRLKQITVGAELMFPDMESISGAKIDALFDIVESLNGESLVVFSQFRRAIERLYPMFIKKGYRVAQLAGTTSVADRPVIINDFQQGEYQILLATTQTGGQGITLTAANKAIFLDKMWTPANNVQAQDRLHRIGQDEAVTIYELLAVDTVEERIERMLAGKQLLFDIIFEDEASLEAKGEMIDLRSMSGEELIRELYG